MCEDGKLVSKGNAGCWHTAYPISHRSGEEWGCIRVELDSAFHRDLVYQFYESLGFEKRAYLSVMGLAGRRVQ
jgi:hypothetical protein